MDYVKQWAVSLLVVCAVGGIVLFLSPSSSVNRNVKTLVLLCLLTVFFTPVLNITKDGFDTDISGGIISESNDEIRDNMLKYACLEAEELCEDIVVKSGAQAIKIKANANIDDGNCIYISDITISMNEKYKAKTDEINEKIKKVFDIESEFIWEK